MQSKLCSTGLLVAMLGATVAEELSAQTYMPVVIEKAFDETRAQDEKVKDKVMKRQQRLLERRYDLGDVSQGKVLSIKNYYELFKGILT